MSLRPYGHAEISPSRPRARGVCDRCGQLWNHDKLKWQYDWRGTKLQNLRLLVCDPCYDEYQQNGQRTIILPADPIPIMNARPENRALQNNPLSAIGANPSPLLWQFSAQIGNLTDAGGVPAAFDGNANKPSFMSAMISVPNSSYNNYVGINWSEFPTTTLPSSLNSPVITHILASFVLAAPNDSTFGSTAYLIEGSSDNSTWTTLNAGNPAGIVGETITAPSTGGSYQYHRANFFGGATGIAVAQAQFYVSDAPTSEV